MAAALLHQGVEKNSRINGQERDENEYVVIEINNDDRIEELCRICHLHNDEESQLFKLGCDCKGDLAISHPNCAKLWFSNKGNRECEICRKTAKNISNVRVYSKWMTNMMGWALLLWFLYWWIWVQIHPMD